MNVYRAQLTLCNKDVNLYRRLRTSALFELLQEVSIHHTEELGAGRALTLDRGFLWMVTMQRAEIARMPEYDERVTVETWPGETMHLLFPRYYRLLDAEGKVLLSASAIWALVDVETRRMIFPDRYGIAIEGVTTGHEIALPTPVKKAEGEPSAVFSVPYSYLDLNGHMNNTRYFDLAEDHIPAPAEGRRLTAVSAEYISEARLGDRIALTVEQTEGDYLLSGETDRRVFRMRLSYT